MREELLEYTLLVLGLKIAARKEAAAVTNEDACSQMEMTLLGRCRASVVEEMYRDDSVDQ